MRLLGDSKRAEFYGQFIGQKIDVLVETTRHRPTGFLKGLTSNYIPVLIDADDDYHNKLVTVRIKNRIGPALAGTVLS